MSNDIERLKRELARQKSKTKSQEEIEDIGKERKQLKRSIRREKFHRRYGKAVATGKVIGRRIGKGAKFTGTAIKKTGEEIAKISRDIEAKRIPIRKVKKKKIKSKPTRNIWEPTQNW